MMYPSEENSERFNLFFIYVFARILCISVASIGLRKPDKVLGDESERNNLPVTEHHNYLAPTVYFALVGS